MMNKDAYYKFDRYKKTHAGDIIIMQTEVVTTWTNALSSHYTNLGYKKREQGMKFSVNVRHLPANSTAKLEAACPVCNSIYITNMNRITIKNSTLCRDCSRRYDISGGIFGRLIAIEPYLETEGKSMWLCECECGNICAVRTDNLIDGTTRSCGCIHDEYLANRTGDNHPRWNGGSSSRYFSGYKKWKDSVHDRDGYSCVRCGSKERIEAHHMDSWKNNREKESHVNNGVTLCKKCHLEFHVKYMGSIWTPCTKKDFFKWLEINGVDCLRIKTKIDST